MTKKRQTIQNLRRRNQSLVQQNAYLKAEWSKVWRKQMNKKELAEMAMVISMIHRIDFKEALILAEKIESDMNEYLEKEIPEPTKTEVDF